MSLPARPLRAVAFDLDGLMFNTEELYEEVAAQLLERRGRRLTPELLDRMMGRPGRISLQVMIDSEGLNATVDELIEESDRLFDVVLAERLAPMPGLFELLGTLEERGLPKGVATSSRRVYATHLLGRFELLPRFEFVLTCEDVSHGKPAPEVYLKAAARHGVAPDEMLVLEDSATGCQAAVAAGAYVVAVPGAHSARHDFPGASFRAAGLSDPRIYEALRR